MDIILSSLLPDFELLLRPLNRSGARKAFLDLRRDPPPCMGSGGDHRYAHVLRTTSLGSLFWVLCIFLALLLGDLAFSRHAELQGELGPPPAAAVAYKGKNAPQGSVYGLDTTKLSGATTRHTAFGEPPLQQLASDDGTISVVFDMPKMAEERVRILLDLQNGSRAGRHGIPTAGSSSAVASHKFVGQCKQLEPGQFVATSLSVSKAGQGQGQRGQGSIQATKRRQGQAAAARGLLSSSSPCRTAYATPSAGATPADNRTSDGCAGHGCTAAPRCSAGSARQGQGGSTGGCGTAFGRSGGSRHPSADQGPTQSCHAAGQSQKGAFQGASGTKKLLFLLGFLHGQAFPAPGEAILGSTEGNRAVRHCRDQVDRELAGSYGQPRAPFWRTAGSAFGLRGHGYRGQVQGGRHVELRGGCSRPTTTAGGPDSSAAASKGGPREQQKGTVPYSRPQSQGHGRQARRGQGLGCRLQSGTEPEACRDAPSIGSRLSPRIRYGPACRSRVQQWTHSAVHYSDFMSDFEAEACGIISAFHLHMESRGFNGTGEWLDYRVVLDETDVNAEWRALLGQGTSGTYPQQSHSLADMDSSSQFECTLSVGNASGTSTKLGSPPAKSHAEGDSATCTAVLYDAGLSSSITHGRLEKPARKVSFDSLTTYWFPRPSQLRPSASCVFSVQTVTVNGVKGGSCRPFRHAASYVPSRMPSQPAADSTAAGRNTKGPKLPLGPHEKSATGSRADAGASKEVSCKPAATSLDDRASPLADDAFPLERPVATAQASVRAKSWFTSFGTVEGQQVLQKSHDWTDLHCIAEAIAHAAPALARPSGRTLRQPLPGLFTPQVVLTRIPVHSPFGTVVFDLRPIGMETRTEDMRLSGQIDGALQGEGVLAPFTRRYGLSVPLLSFAVNGNAVPANFVLHAGVETITMPARLPSHPYLPPVPMPRSMPEEPDSEQEPVPRSIDFSGGTRSSSGSSRDHRLYRPLRPPTPPVPPDSMPDVASIGQAFTAGARFTVFDVWHHKRHLPRHEGQRVLDLVELALSLTPEVRRPWGHRTQNVEWADMPSPQLVI